MKISPGKQDDSDDTELLAVKLREVKGSPRRSYIPGEFRKMAAQVITARRKAKAA